MNTISKADILKLSVAERILLAQDIWDSSAETPEEIPLPESHKLELDKRLDAFHENPSEGSTWEMIRDRIRAGRTS